MLWLFDPAAYTFWPKCMFHAITGLNCPACGIQRFLHALWQGNVTRALHFNYWLVYALPYTILIVAAWLLPEGSALKNRMESKLHSRVAVWTYVVSFTVWFVVRNILGI